MEGDLLTAREAARRLGISVTTFYGWLGQSDYGLLVIRGQPVTIDYLQGGPRGRGRVRIDAAEVDRINSLMRVRPKSLVERRPRTVPESFPGISVPLGRPR